MRTANLLVWAGRRPSPPPSTSNERQLLKIGKHLKRLVKGGGSISLVPTSQLRFGETLLVYNICRQAEAAEICHSSTLNDEAL